MTKLMERMLEHLAPFPSPDEREAHIEQARRDRDVVARLAKQLHEKTRHVEQVRARNGFREAVAMNFRSRGHDTA